MFSSKDFQKDECILIFILLNITKRKQTKKPFKVTILRERDIQHLLPKTW